jgi:hypothetical protein
MEAECSLPCSYQLTTGLHPESDESNTHRPMSCNIDPDNVNDPTKQKETYVILSYVVGTTSCSQMMSKFLFT